MIARADRARLSGAFEKLSSAGGAKPPYSPVA
jgi:hypothetical protein